MLRETVAKWTRKSQKIRFSTLKSLMPNFQHVGNFFFLCLMTKMYKYEKLSIGSNLLLTNFHKAGIKNEDFLLIATSKRQNFFFQKWLEIDIFFSTNDGWCTKMSFWPLKNVNPTDYGPLWPLLDINDFSVEISGPFCNSLP